MYNKVLQYIAYSTSNIIFPSYLVFFNNVKTNNLWKMEVVQDIIAAVT